MKKIISILLVTMMLFSFVGCATSTNSETSMTTTKASTMTAEATTVSVAETTEKFDYDLSAITQNWVVDYYVDDWGDTTDEAYLVYETTDGSFSDSAAVNSNLTAGVIVDKNDLQFVFLKYDRNYYKPIADVKYTISVKDSNGNVKNYSAWQNAGDERVYTNDTSSIVSMFETAGTYSFYFECDRFEDTYTFKVNTDKFSSAYSDL